MPDANAHPIPGLKLFRFHALIVEDQTAVGHHTVHVAEDHLNLFAAVIESHRLGTKRFSE